MTSITEVDLEITYAAPTAGNDSIAGYRVGSTWINSATKRSFTCIDATPRAALWRETVGSSEPGSFVLVGRKADLPPAAGGVITLADNVTYFFTTIVDLAGDRIVSGKNTTIIGGSSENCGIKSTGLTGAALISSEWSLPLRHVQLEAAQIFDLNAIGNANQALDWYGVNLLNTSNIGTIADYANFVVASMAFLNASGLTFDGEFGTISFSNTLFVGTSPGTTITIPATGTITRRFRIVYSSVVSFGSGVALDVSTSASIPVEGYILDTVNFSGGGTYLSGVQPSDNKSRFIECRGVRNSAAVAQYYMQNNATATTVSVIGDTYKAAGTTTLAAISEKFTHTNNRATYTGALLREFKVTATGTVVSGNGNQIGVYLARNGVVLSESEQYVTANSAGRFESVTIMTIVALDPNDYIEVFVENGSAATNITVSFLNVTIEAIS